MEQDFNKPLQNYVSDCLRIAQCEVGNSLEMPLEDQDILENLKYTPVKSEEKDYLKNSTHPHSLELSSKTPLNCRTHRRLAKEILDVSPVRKEGSRTGELIELKQHMSRLPGCMFLGSKVTQTMASIRALDEESVKIIVDSRSDLTLISQKVLDNLKTKPKIKKGQKIDLIQVIGLTLISGYITLDLIFHMEGRLVKIVVEAYVVKGMATPFILRNDFANHYSISIVRNEGECYLNFDKSGYRLQVESLMEPAYLSDHGHSFKVHVLPNFAARNFKNQGSL